MIPMVTQRIPAVLIAAILLAGGMATAQVQQNPQSTVPAATSAPAVTVVPAPMPAVVEVPAASAAGRVEPAGVDAVQAFGMSWREAWTYGGVIMWFILALSVLGGTLAIYFLFILRPSQIAPRALLAEVRDRLAEGDLNAVRRACENRSTPLSAVTLVALDYIRSAADTHAPMLKDMVEAEGSRQANDIQSQTQYLLDISVISPMLGLLGTVLGMLKAFGSVATDIASAKPVVLAAGVSQAIVTTIFGLLVAIPAMIAYAYFRRRAARQIAALEAAAAVLANALASRFKK